MLCFEINAEQNLRTATSAPIQELLQVLQGFFFKKRKEKETEVPGGQSQ